jgi:drug/metabolite transporter (DMT)-like permease
MSKKTIIILGFLALMVIDTFSQICFKSAALHAAPFEASAEWVWRILGSLWIYGAVLGYLGAFFAWMTLLRHAPVGPAFAASHLEVVGVMIISVPLFNESLSLQQMFGAALIIAGVISLSMGEKPDTDVQH